MSKTQSILDKFRPFFNPKSLVVIGASRNKVTFNGQVVKNLLTSQYRGDIHIIHPYTEEIFGITCFPTMEDLLDKNKVSNFPELAIILTTNKMIPNMEKLGKMGIKHVLIEADVNVNYSEQRLNELIQIFKDIIKKYDMHVLGPSMIGIIDFLNCFSSSVIPSRSYILKPYKSGSYISNPPTTGVSFFAQSGGLSGGLGWWEPPQAIQFSKIIHIGYALNITESEILEYLFEDPSTSVIIMYLKEIKEEFIPIIKKNIKKKPLLYKYVGKQSLDVDLQATGAIKVQNYIELFDYAALFSWSPLPSSKNVGIIGPSSGVINLLISEMREHGIHLGKLNDSNLNQIQDEIKGSTCKLGNPIDYWPPKEFVGPDISRTYELGSNILLQDDNISILILALEFFTEIEFNFRIFNEIKQKYKDKVIVGVLVQPEKEGEQRIVKIANEIHIPIFINEPERAIRGIKALIDYSKTLKGTPNK